MIILAHPKGSTFVYLTVTVRLTIVLSGRKTPTLPPAPKKRRQIKWQHDDGVGGSFKYESNETFFDEDRDIHTETYELLSEVTDKLAEMKTRLHKLDHLQNELKQFCTTVNGQLTQSLSK